MSLPGKPRTILVVDDEQDILDSLKVLLEATTGVTVETALSGAQGLKILSEKPVHLIVTDYKMPVMNGIDFLERACQAHAGIPAIMITAFPDPALAQKAINQLGVRHFIPKPLDLDFFLKAIDFALSGSPSIKRGPPKDIA